MKKCIFVVLLIAAGMTVKAAESYLRLDSCRVVTNTLPVAQGKAPLPQAYDGQGIIVGVIDGGMQYNHPTFRNEKGELRIRKIWDRNEDGAEVVLNDPAAILARKYSYCSLYGPLPTNHAAHVAGIAVGSGRYKGMAPASEIVFADAALNMHIDSTAYYYHKRVVNMVRAMEAYADSVGKPIVINISMGVDLGFSTEQKAYQEEFKSLTGPGHIIVTAAGNAGNAEEGTTYMNSGTHNEAQFKVWFPGVPMASDLYIRSTDTVLLSFDNMDELKQMFDFQYKRLPDDPQGKKVYQVRLIPKSEEPARTETLVTGKGTAPFEVFACVSYIRSVSPSDCTLSTAYTVGMPATFPNVIAVANYALGDNGHLEMAPSSSWGPSWDGRNKPDVTAVGSVLSAGNYYCKSNKSEVVESYDAEGITGLETWVSQYGTSQASPMTAGIIALWLQAKPDLTPEDIMAVIKKTAKPLETVPNNKSGAGLIDAYAGLLEVLAIPQALPEIYTWQPEEVQFRLNGTTLYMDGAGQGFVTIYTLSGQQMLATSFADGYVSVANLPTGVYAVQLKTADARTTGSTLIRIP